MSDRNAIHKSSLPQLIKRGYIDYLPIEDDHYTYDESLAKLQSKMAVERSIAARTLKQHILKKGVAEELINALIKEKALYTKLEISDALALGNRTTLLLMLPYVGSMKNHQYDVVPKQPSRKISVAYDGEFSLLTHPSRSSLAALVWACLCFLLRQ